MKTTNTRPLFPETSIPLTGFSELELLGTGTLETYHNVVINQNAPAVAEVFFATAVLADYPPTQWHAQLAAQLIPDSLFGGLAQHIITA